ncbi:MAG: AlpA family phage regulatory protein [Telluria sp.]|nr:AlpA family phage regulatory protein [Telluria sp.]
MKAIFLDLPALAAAIAISESTIQRLVREGSIPKPRQLSGRRVAWLVREVEEWAENRPVSDLLPPANTGRRKN